MQTISAWKKTVLGVILSISMSAVALAARVHLKGELAFEDLGEQLETTLSLAGLGNKDITIVVTVTGTAHVTYINPGNNVPAGQNKIPIKAVSWQTIPRKLIKNGTVTATLTSPEVELDPAPNPNWTVQLDDVEFETATITVVQGGKTVLNQTIEL